MKEKFYEIKGTRCRYLEGGKGKTLVFFHGGGLSVTSYKENLKFLSSKFHVIAPEIPCFGKSPAPKEIWNYKDYATYFLSFIKDLKIKNYILIGYSFGGGIALNIASLEPKNIEKLVLCNTSGLKTHFTRTKLFNRILNEAYVSIKKIKNLKELNIFIRIVFDFILNLIKNIFISNKILKNILKSFSTQTPKLSKIKCKTLIIWAKKDMFFSIDHAYQLIDKIKKSKLKKLNHTHLWILLKHKEFNKLLSDFL
jgi:pimeloyl-ACP methyl ester carboxylesterase